MSDFLNYKDVERGLSENTRERYRKSLLDFCLFLGEGERVSRAKARQVRDHISSCYERGLKASTISNRISTLREFFKFLQMDGLIRLESDDGCSTAQERKAPAKGYFRG